MNENLDLVEILKDCPVGTKLYSTIHGEVVFNCVRYHDIDYPIGVSYIGDEIGYTRDGRLDKRYDGECILFPSKDQRDWSKFKAPVKKFDYSTLKPFDRVLARMGYGDAYMWFADFVSVPATAFDRIPPCIMSDKDCDMIIPYNDDTKHLIGTSDEAPEYYRYWEE